MKKIVQIYKKAEEIVCGALTLLGLAIILYNFVCRYVLHNPHPETDEICMIILSIAIILGFSINAGEDNYIDMDLIYTSLKSRAAIVFFDLFRKVCLCVYSVFIAFYGYQAMAMQRMTGRAFPLTQIPFWEAYTIIIFVGVILTITSVGQLIGYVTDLCKNKKEGNQE